MARAVPDSFSAIGLVEGVPGDGSTVKIAASQAELPVQTKKSRERDLVSDAAGRTARVMRARVTVRIP